MIFNVILVCSGSDPVFTVKHLKICWNVIISSPCSSSITLQAISYCLLYNNISLCVAERNWFRNTELHSVKKVKLKNEIMKCVREQQPLRRCCECHVTITLLFDWLQVVTASSSSALTLSLNWENGASLWSEHITTRSEKHTHTHTHTLGTIRTHSILP